MTLTFAAILLITIPISRYLVSRNRKILPWVVGGYVILITVMVYYLTSLLSGL